MLSVPSSIHSICQPGLVGRGPQRRKRETGRGQPRDRQEGAVVAVETEPRQRERDPEEGRSASRKKATFPEAGKRAPVPPSVSANRSRTATTGDRPSGRGLDTIPSNVPSRKGAMSGNAPTVSVIIPCYNLGAYVNEAVQSVLDQTYTDFEILVIDDGSTDPITRHLFASYRRPRTRILRTENQGLARTRNLGIREAAGRYLSFLDADDVLEPAFLERTVHLLEADPSLAFVSCWLVGFGESRFLCTPATCDFPHLLAEDTVCTAALTRKDALVAVGGFDDTMPLPGYESWDLAIGLL